jgi:hypothetical protein
MLVNVNAKKAHHRIQPSKLFKLPQDKKFNKGKTYSHEEMKEFAKEIEKAQKKNKLKKSK